MVCILNDTLEGEEYNHTEESSNIFLEIQIELLRVSHPPIPPETKQLPIGWMSMLSTSLMCPCSPAKIAIHVPLSRLHNRMLLSLDAEKSRYVVKGCTRSWFTGPPCPTNTARTWNLSNDRTVIMPLNPPKVIIGTCMESAPQQLHAKWLKYSY